jgi:hypothetical protein
MYTYVLIKESSMGMIFKIAAGVLASGYTL